MKQIDTAQDSLIHDLGILPTDPADTAAHAMRKRIHAHFTDLHHERETIEAQLKALASDTGRGNDPDLLDELPELAGRLDELPEHIQAELFAAFDIQVLWNPPMRQATFFATITDTTPGIITDLLARAGDDNPGSAAAPATSSNAVAGFTRSPYAAENSAHSGPNAPAWSADGTRGLGGASGAGSRGGGCRRCSGGGAGSCGGGAVRAHAVGGRCGLTRWGGASRPLAGRRAFPAGARRWPYWTEHRAQGR